MIQFITHSNNRYGYVDGARLALEGGCRWVQLRMKEATEAEFMAAAAEIGRLCKEHGATFVLDDHVEWVEKTGADGVHLGKNDMPVWQARALLGNSALIGGTANTFDDIRKLYHEGASYIGCGPFRFTTTKKGLSPLLGSAGIRTIVESMRNEKISLPIVAIGGITAEDIPLLMRCGVNGIAVSGAVLHAANPVEEMQRIVAVTSSFL